MMSAPAATNESELAQRVFDHQMHILEQRCLEPGNDGRAHSQHGTEHAIHHIEVQQIDAGALEQLQLRAQREPVRSRAPQR